MEWNADFIGNFQFSTLYELTMVSLIRLYDSLLDFAKVVLLHVIIILILCCIVVGIFLRVLIVST